MPSDAAVAQLARASACHAEGRGFESLQPLPVEAPPWRGFLLLDIGASCSERHVRILFMSKDELHQMIDRLPDQAVDGAAILLREVSDGRIDPEQAWFWTREWQQREREADKDLASGKVTRFESDEE